MKKSIYTVDQIDALLSGKGMAILGRYDSTDEITDPVEGGHYYIGTEEPYNVYTYVNGAWVNAGPLAIPGPPGPAFTYQDFTPAQLAGLRGKDGKSPYIDASTNNWMVWDEEKDSFVDTGVNAGGKAPSIGANGNWFIDGNDTGVPATNAQFVAEAKAYAEAAAASAANAGKPPYIGDNGNWFAWDLASGKFVDTGEKAEGVTVSSVSESTEDGGENIVTFSDGKTLAVKNGKQGGKGDPGYTPVRGKDYWTPNDKNAIAADISVEVAEQLAGKAQLKPEFAESVAWLEKNGDQSLLYVLPDGYIYAYMAGEGGEPVPNFTNKADPTAAYWKEGYRINSSLAQVEAQYNTCTNWIPFTKGDIIRVAGMRIAISGNSVGGELVSGASGVSYVRFAISNDGVTPYTTTQPQVNTPNAITVVDGVEIIDTSLMNFEGTPKYFCLVGILEGTSDEVIITVNQEITYSEVSSYGWRSTGLKITATIYTDLVGIVGENNVIYLSDRNLPAGTYTLKYGDETYETIGTITVE